MRDYWLYYRLYLVDIIQEMDRAEAFVENMDFVDFQGDDKTASAAVRKLEIISEATRRIPAEIRRKYPKLPWGEMAGMRDRLIHAYFGVDHRLVWRTITQRIPRVKRLLKEILESKP